MKQRYWHFARDDRTLGYEDGRKIVIGKTLTVKPPIKMCERGLHASRRIIDALKYAPGAYLCLVELSGIVEHGDDKSVATERKVIAAADATEMLYRFAMDCAARAMEQAGWTHGDSWNALAIRQAHMAGLADDVTWGAAWSAAESAAWGAAESAAESAAWSAARSAEHEIQNAELTRRAYRLLKIK